MPKLKSLAFRFFRWVKFYLPRWLIAGVFTILLGVSLQTQMVIAGLNELGANIGLSQSLSMTGYDLLYLSQMYGIFILIALFIAFFAGGLLHRFVKFGRPVIYAIAGGVAIFVMLFAMKQAFFGVHLISGASDGLGIGLQIIAGVIGGLLFARLSQKKSPA